MTSLMDRPDRYGTVTRVLHWGMALLFLAQFASAGARWGLPRGHGLREALWGYHVQLGVTLFVLVMLRGAWGLANVTRRPAHAPGLGQLARWGHVALYLLMIAVPGSRLLAAAGGTRGLDYLGLQVFPARETAIAWTQLAAEWHGEAGWLLGLMILGHVAMALGWHQMIRRDGVLRRMAG